MDFLWSRLAAAPDTSPEVLFDVDFSAETDQAPAASVLTFGGQDWSVENSGNDANGGPDIASGALRFAPAAATPIDGNDRLGPLLTLPLADLGAAASEHLRLWLELEQLSGAANVQALWFGIESGVAGLGANNAAQMAHTGRFGHMGGDVGKLATADLWAYQSAYSSGGSIVLGAGRHVVVWDWYAETHQLGTAAAVGDTVTLLGNRRGLASDTTPFDSPRLVLGASYSASGTPLPTWEVYRLRLERLPS